MGTRFQKQRDEIQEVRDGELASGVDAIELFDILDAEFDRLDAAIEHVRNEVLEADKSNPDIVPPEPRVVTEGCKLPAEHGEGYSA